jgi:hypothetical protein
MQTAPFKTNIVNAILDPIQTNLETDWIAVFGLFWSGKIGFLYRNHRIGL